MSANTDIEVEIQFALDDRDAAESECEEPPSQQALSHWAQSAYMAVASPSSQPTEVTIRIVSATEMQNLNHHFRDKNRILQYGRGNYTWFCAAFLGANPIFPIIVLSHADVGPLRRNVGFSTIFHEA